MLLPPFKVNKDGTPASTRQTYSNRFQNGRNKTQPFPRMVLSSEFQQYCGRAEKTVVWADPGEERLKDNVRNDMFETLVKAYRTKELQLHSAPPPHAMRWTLV